MHQNPESKYLIIASLFACRVLLSKTRVETYLEIDSLKISIFSKKKKKYYFIKINILTSCQFKLPKYLNSMTQA